MIALLAQAASQPALWEHTVALPSCWIIPLLIAVIFIGVTCYVHGRDSGYLNGLEIGTERGQDRSDSVRRWTEQAVLKAFARHESPTTSVVSVIRKALDLIETPPPDPQEKPAEDEDDDDDQDEDEDEEDDDQ